MADSERFKGKTLFVRSIPFSASNDEFSSLFSDIGPVKESFIVKEKGSDKSRGFGYVTFSLREDAVAAESQSLRLAGQVLSTTFADNKFKKGKKPAAAVKSEESLPYHPPSGSTHRKSSMTSEGQTDICRLSQKNIRNLTKPSTKQSRLIIRNLSFKCTEKILKEQFSRFGVVTEVTIPAKKDGKMLGFGFVQLQNVSDASKALQHMNTTQILGRPVAVDWAVSKDKFVASMAEQTDVMSSEVTAQPDGDQGDGDVEEEEMELADDDSMESSEEEDGEEEEEMEVDEEEEEGGDDIGSEGYSEGESVDSDSEGDEDDSDEAEEEKKKAKPPKDDGPKKAKKQWKSDVNLGQTLFVRNLPFTCEEEDISDVFEEFGPLNYCLMLRNKQTEQPKGMAFVQFGTKAAADDCLKAADDSQVEGLVLEGRRLKVTLALSRDQTQKLQKESKEPAEDKDKRNLSLVREGMIRAGTQAAQSLSRDDIIKRDKIEAVKRQKLKKPDIFVSETRLCVHNLPISLSDQQLRKVFCTAAGDAKARITECRIMRDLDKVNSQGVGKSRGYAFVNFTEHAHALAALRKTNNNPDIFGAKRKPIVEFSLENKTALMAKEKRLERMKAKQEMLKKTGGSRNNRQQKTEQKTKTTAKPPSKPAWKASAAKSATPAGGAKGIKNLPSHHGPKLRHKPRASQQKASGKKASRKRKQSAPPSKQPIAKKLKMAPKKRKQNTDNFDKLVNKYSNTGSSHAKQQKKSSDRWFNS